MTIIITITSLLIISYLFDLISPRTKIPSVILLLILGWLVRQVTMLLNINLPDLTAILPILGTIGLILIVLEGSLELEINRSKLSLIRKSIIGAFLPMMAMAFLLAYMFYYTGQFSFKNSLINAIPFCVISSAIAIPSVRGLSHSDREFIIYESSLSDILGVLFFNFIALNNNFDTYSFSQFGLQLIIMSVISFIATIGLTLLLNRIEHHIKFVPIILLVILIYEISKAFHLPALIFILLFGIFLKNLDGLKHIRLIERFKSEDLNKEVTRFGELTVEAAFLIRALFFLLFGYLLETSEILNPVTLKWAVGIVAAIFIFRIIQLKISRLPLLPLLFLAPRGLITILLFISIGATQRIPLVNKSMIIQVIVLTALAMMIGLLISKNNNGSIPKTDSVRE